MHGTRPLRFDGWIAGAAFETGHRFVIGWWPSSPFGAFVDVMWSQPDGTRVLLVTRDEIRDFVGAHYRFDRCERVPIRLVTRGDTVAVSAGRCGVRYSIAGRGAMSFLLALRPAAIRTDTRWIGVEDRLLRPLSGPLFGSATQIHARGRTAQGARQWYAIHDYRAIRAQATVDGADAGPTVGEAIEGFGFSAFPPRAAQVRVTSMIDATLPRHRPPRAPPR